MAGPRSPEALSAGRVGRPHGLDGSFHVTRARPRLLEPGVRVLVGGHTHEIASRRGVEQNPILNLHGIADRAAAEALRGLDLRVPLAEAPALQAGEWWAHELEGCEVHSAERHLGTVLALLELPSCELLQVALPDGGELLVPLVKDAIRHIDPAARRIEIDLDFLGATSAGEQGEAAAGES
jgi:16S rRNA processing protein RimM